MYKGEYLRNFQKHWNQTPAGAQELQRRKPGAEADAKSKIAALEQLWNQAYMAGTQWHWV